MKDSTLAEKLNMQFHRCHKLLKRSAFEQRMEHFKAVPYRGQGKILRLLFDKGEMSQKDIVIEMDVRPSTAWELVGKLERVGFVEKVQNPDDKRGCIVKLTESGKKEAQSVKWDLNKMSAELFSALNEEEQLQLSNLLDKLIASLKKNEAEEAESSCDDSEFDESDDDDSVKPSRKVKCGLQEDIAESKKFFKTLFKDLGFTKKNSNKSKDNVEVDEVQVEIVLNKDSKDQE